MKLLFTLGFSLLFFTTFATVKTTVADGSWFNASNWSPVGVPLFEDTVIINHNITVTTNSVDFGANWLIVNPNASITGDTIFALHGNLRLLGTMNLQTIAIGDGDSTLVYGIVDGLKFVPGNPVNINYGSIISDTLVAGDNFDNFGSIDINDLITGGLVFNNHSSAAITVATSGTIGSSFTSNEINATMVFGTLITGGDITNNGDISCVSWTHGSGIADGVTGKYCVSLCFMNVSTINGTIDICDSSPSGPCDLQMGTIAGTVTYCASGSCTNNMGITENTEDLFLYPNPVNSTLNIENVEIGKSYSVMNINGQMHLKGVINSAIMQIDLMQLETGIYFLIVGNGDSMFVKKFIKD